ncbi:ABC transporter substrate-binding protein [Actinoplanes utahensis]|nr:ABC transporter substrate-binding protein [Actinoplanes utahensis]
MGTAVVALLALTACSTPAATGPGSATDTFVVATAGEPDNLNPVLGYGADGASLIFDGLVARDDRNALSPALATDLPTVSADGRTVTARLRTGVTFHDGKALTADDVVFTYRSILDPKVDSTIRSDLDMLDKVTASGADTVVFTLKYPYTPFLQRLTIGILPELPGQDMNKSEINRKPVGTGPYRVTSWTPGDKLVLAANDTYWGGKPTNSGVIVAFVADDNVRAQRARAGEFDAVEVAPRLATAFGGYTVHKVPTADYRGVMLPMNGPVTGDLAIRRAVNAAVDRQAMVTGVLAGAGDPAYGPIPPTSEYAAPAPTVGDAATILDEAGWTLGADGIRARNGQRARFTLMYPASDSLRKELALAVTADAKKAGIEITPEGLTWDAIDPRMKDDALIMGWGTPYDPDFVSYKLFGSRFAGEGYFNPGSYASAVTDEALEKGRTSSDPAERKAAYQRFQEQLAADVPWVFLTYLRHTYLVRDDVAGVRPRVEPHAHGVENAIWWNIHTWTRK